MAKTLSEAIEQIKRDATIEHVDQPVVGQRVFALYANDHGGHLHLCLATVQRVTPQFVDLLLYVTGDNVIRTSRRNVWTNKAPINELDWCGGKHGDPYVSPWCNGTKQCWTGTVYIDRVGYSRDYPALDYDHDDLKPIDVLHDWQREPASFTKD
jgi:hypothetical protein